MARFTRIVNITSLIQLALDPKIITSLKFNQKDSSFPPLLPESVLPSWADPMIYNEIYQI